MEKQEQQHTAFHVGLKMLEIAYSVLGEQVGHDPEAFEVAAMAEIMAKALLADAYLGVRAVEGPEAAEKWLRKTLALASAAVRSTGSEAFIKIDVIIKDVPNKMVKAPAEVMTPSPEPPPAAPVCACEKVAGSCPSCTDKLAESIRNLFEIMGKLSQFKDAGDVCAACAVTEFDGALARSLAEFWKMGEGLEGDAKARFVHGLRDSLVEMAALKGIREIPLTLKAWQERKDAEKIQDLA